MTIGSDLLTAVALRRWMCEGVLVCVELQLRRPLVLPGRIVWQRRVSAGRNVHLHSLQAGLRVEGISRSTGKVFRTWFARALQNFSRPAEAA